MWILPLLLACQQPFGTDRHDLTGFRVAAVAAWRVGDVVNPRAALVVDGHLWADSAVDLRWYVLDATTDIADVDVATPPDAIGPTPSLVAGMERLGLIATGPAGEVRRTYLDTPGENGSLWLGNVEQGVVDGLTVGSATAEAFAPEARAALEAVSGTPQPGDVLRLHVDVPSDVRTRWMSASDGAFFELDRATTDWAAGDLVFDDEDVVTAAPLAEGPVSFLVLGLAPGQTAFAPFDVVLGEPPEGIWVNQRWIPSDVPIISGRARVTLAVDADSPTGLRITAAEAAPGAAAVAIPCARHAGFFDPNWLVDGRCLTTDFDGVSVVVDAL